MDLQTPFGPRLSLYTRSIVDCPFNATSVVSGDLALKEFTVNYMMDKNTKDETVYLKNQYGSSMGLIGECNPKQSHTIQNGCVTFFPHTHKDMNV